MKIAILDDYQDAVRKLNCFSMLASHEVNIYNQFARGMSCLTSRMLEVDAIILIGNRTRVNNAFLDKMPRLKLICQIGPCGDHIDLAACTARNIAITEGQDTTVAPAELTWGLIIAAQRRIPQYIANLKQGAWQQAGLKSATMPQNFRIGKTLSGQTLGIWGYGNIGRLVARYGHAFNMKILVWGSKASRHRAVEDGYLAAESKEQFFASSDILTLHLRLLKETTNIVTMHDLALMKPDSLLVNTSRAELIQNGALAAAIAQGRPGLVAVDVFENEPILQGHNLLRTENAICTPHIGYVEQNAYETSFSEAFKNINDFFTGNYSKVINSAVFQSSF